MNSWKLLCAACQWGMALWSVVNDWVNNWAAYNVHLKKQHASNICPNMRSIYEPLVQKTFNNMFLLQTHFITSIECLKYNPYLFVCLLVFNTMPASVAIFMCWMKFKKVEKVAQFDGKLWIWQHLRSMLSYGSKHRGHKVSDYVFIYCVIEIMHRQYE